MNSVSHRIEGFLTGVFYYLNNFQNKIRFFLFDLLPCLTFSPAGLCTAHPLGRLLPLDPILLSVRSQTAKIRWELKHTQSYTSQMSYLAGSSISQKHQKKPKCWTSEIAFTFSNVRLGLQFCSHCIISKKMGMVAFLSSGSGTSVTSRMGPTMAGMNFILCGPEGQQNIITQKFHSVIWEGNKLHLHFSTNRGQI